MATTYGVNRTKIRAGGHQNIISPDEQGARVKWVHDSAEAAGVAKGSFIYMGGQIPAGAQILPESKIYHDNLGSNTAIAVGTSELGVELSASEATTAAGSVDLGADVDSFGTKLTAASDIIVTSSGSGALTGTLRLDLYYAV